MRQLLRIYKLTLSPIMEFMFSSKCRYRPTCSEYSVDVIQKYGIIKGGVLAWKRIMSCR